MTLTYGLITLSDTMYTNLTHGHTIEVTLYLCDPYLWIHHFK